MNNTTELDPATDGSLMAREIARECREFASDRYATRHTLGILAQVVADQAVAIETMNLRLYAAIASINTQRRVITKLENQLAALEHAMEEIGEVPELDAAALTAPVNVTEHHWHLPDGGEAIAVGHIVRIGPGAAK